MSLKPAQYERAPPPPKGRAESRIAPAPAVVSRRVALRLAQAGFWAAAAVALVLALLPEGEAPHILPWDKAGHFLAFYVLGVLGAAAYPRFRLLWVGLALSLFGGGIEVLQGLPIIARDADPLDWAADSAGVLCAFGPVALAWWRQRFAPRRR